MCLANVNHYLQPTTICVSDSINALENMQSMLPSPNSVTVKTFCDLQLEMFTYGYIQMHENPHKNSYD